MSYIPWFAWIALAGVFGWIVIALTGNLSQRRTPTDDRLQAALEESAAATRQLAERLDQVDKRLAAIEKTLNDIP